MPGRSPSPVSRKISFPPEEVLHSAVQEGDTGELWRLLSGPQASSLQLDKPNHAGLTPIHHSVLNNNLDAIKMLTCAGADVNIADAYGFSPLHTAAACGYEEVTSLLLIYGADVFSLTTDGDLPVDVAKDDSIGRLLTDHMVQEVHQDQLVRGWLLYQARTLYFLLVQWVQVLWDRTREFLESQRTSTQLAITSSSQSKSRPDSLSSIEDLEEPVTTKSPHGNHDKQD